MTDTIKELRRLAKEAFVVRPVVSDLLQVRTPFRYADGEIVDVWLLPSKQRVHDAAETVRYLRISQPITAKENRTIKHVCDVAGADFYHGIISRTTTTSPQDIWADILSVAHACAAVSWAVEAMRRPKS